VNLGAGEIFAIVALTLLIFGPSKIPEIARAVARGYRELTRLRQQMDSTLDDVKRDLQLDQELLSAEPEATRPAGAAGLIRPPEGERAAARAGTLPAATPAAASAPERFLFEPLPVPEEDDYLSAEPAPPTAGPADAEDYLGSSG
jgi:Sec-independent protein translocase protein TatA